jgi:hypothetical protein
MSSNVMAILEDARSRLVAAQQRAQDIEAHARRILDLLHQEAEAWRGAMEVDQDRAKGVAKRLSERWSELEGRISALSKRANQDWAGLEQGFGEHWHAMRQSWTDCDENLKAIPQLLKEHQQGCEKSKEGHQRLAASYDETLQGACNNLQSATKGNQALGAEFTDKASESGQAIDVSIGRYGASSRNAAEAARMRQAAVNQHVAERRAEFDDRTSRNHEEFESGINEQIDRLKLTADQVRTDMENTANVISELTSTLVKGADGVVDTLNVTNIGLRTVVEIVKTSVEICDEVIDTWNN